LIYNENFGGGDLDNGENRTYIFFVYRTYKLIILVREITQ
jgi:hypothetical protein